MWNTGNDIKTIVNTIITVVSPGTEERDILSVLTMCLLITALA
jgi:hypothetical protein